MPTYKERPKLNWKKKILVFILSIWIKTLRIKIYNKPRTNCVFAIWHEESFASFKTFNYFNKTMGLASKSNDGDITTTIFLNNKSEVIRGSSSKNAMSSLKKLVKAGINGFTIGISIDGPRGPRREPKHGVAFIAKKSNIPIHCVRFKYNGFILKKSWDKSRIPFPFAKISVYMSPPIVVSDEKDGVENAMNECVYMMGTYLEDEMNKK
jgi:lysophospholipid acyltransferase (LPLAT)-like uncharacterized protein